MASWRRPFRGRHRGQRPAPLWDAPTGELATTSLARHGLPHPNFGKNRCASWSPLLCPGGPASACGGRLLDRADLGAGELGVDEELERVELLVLLHEAVQRGAAQPGQRAAGGVAQQARLDDFQGEGVIALADEGGSGGGELLLPASGEQVERGGVPGRGRRLESGPVWLPVTGALVVEPLGEVVAG